MTTDGPQDDRTTKRIAALFDIDGTLITGGPGAAAWRLAFEGLYGIPADIDEFTDTGMSDPEEPAGDHTRRLVGSAG
jgi:FMN phosphatase YigB (HAD superfamily)